MNRPAHFLDDARRDRRIDDEPKPLLSPEADSLASDLLGATLVDAQDELRKAIEEVEKAGSPAGRGFASDAASSLAAGLGGEAVEERGRRATTLIETLAGQIAPESGAAALAVAKLAAASKADRRRSPLGAGRRRARQAGARASVPRLASRRVDAMGAAAVSLGGPAGGLAFSLLTSIRSSEP